MDPLVATTLVSLDHPVRLGDRGPVVTVLRDRLVQACVLRSDVQLPEPDPSLFDERLDRAVRAFQQERGLIADGVVGRQTALLLDGARWQLGDRTLLRTAGHLMRGDDVSALQERLVVLGVHAGPVDGIFGPETEASLREFQRGLGVDPDGICGPPMFEALAALERSVGAGGDAWALRSRARVSMAGASLSGKRLVLDPATGEDVGRHGVSEVDVTTAVAARLAGRLRDIGAHVTVGPAPNDAPAAVNPPDLVLFLCCDSHESEHAAGVATHYWDGGRVGQHSATGERLATLIQREIVARTDLVDCRSHPCSYDVVRLTRTPAIVITLGYLSNAADARRLADAQFQEVVAEALLFAVQRLYLDGKDPATGTLKLSDVQAFAGLA